MNITCPLMNINSKIKLPCESFLTIWIILYIFMATSMYLLATTTHTKYNTIWIKLALFISIIEYILLYLHIYQSNCKKDDTLHVYIAYLTILPLQLLLVFFVNPLAGILLAPVFGWSFLTHVNQY